jgi:hypothetical protein
MSTNKQHRIDEIMDSLDGCTRAAAPDFFYTRLRARMENEASPTTSGFWLLRPAFAFASMAIILLINLLVVFSQSNNNTDDAVVATETDGFQSMAAEYRLNEGNSSISYYNLNQDR